MQAYELIEKREGTHVTGLPTGYYELDDLTCGLQNGEMIIIAGRPSMGKTALALNIAEHVGIVEKIPLAIFSLEMGQPAVGRAVPVQLQRRRLPARPQGDAQHGALSKAGGGLRDHLGGPDLHRRHVGPDAAGAAGQGPATQEHARHPGHRRRLSPVDGPGDGQDRIPPAGNHRDLAVHEVTGSRAQRPGDRAQPAQPFPGRPGRTTARE